jgi:NADH-quinone oxidoreductase subunit A
MLIEYLPILFFLAIAIGFAGFAVVASSLLGQKKPSAAKLAPYECGMPSVGPTYMRIPIRYYIFAMLFILFDIEIVFLYPLAVLFKELKVFGFLAMAVFIAVLIIAYLYVWKKGALEWE